MKKRRREKLKIKTLRIQIMSVREKIRRRKEKFKTLKVSKSLRLIQKRCRKIRRKRKVKRKCGDSSKKVINQSEEAQ